MHRIILDTDLAMGAPGSDIDDGFAVALAVAEPKIQIDAITTVDGNTDVNSATYLTAQLLNKLGSNPPLYAGASGPLMDPRRPRECAAGDVALRFTEKVREARIPAAQAIVEHINHHPGELSVVTIGPLTNLAVALQLDPALPTKIASTWIMGGYFSGSQWNNSVPGEFNIWADPEAAQIVLSSGLFPNMVGLDVTYQVTMSQAQAAELSHSHSPFGRYAGQCGLEWIEVLRKRYPRSATHGKFHLHDPLTVAALADPSLVEWEDAHVEIPLHSVARGMTIADTTAPEGGPQPNCRIARGVQSERFVDDFIVKMQSL